MPGSDAMLTCSPLIDDVLVGFVGDHPQVAVARDLREPLDVWRVRTPPDGLFGELR